jgi:hypothetical protein
MSKNNTTSIVKSISIFFIFVVKFLQLKIFMYGHLLLQLLNIYQRQSKGNPKANYKKMLTVLLDSHSELTMSKELKI